MYVQYLQELILDGLDFIYDTIFGGGDFEGSGAKPLGAMWSAPGSFWVKMHSNPRIIMISLVLI